MFDFTELSGATTQAAPVGSQTAAGMQMRYLARGQTPPADPRWSIPMLGAIRLMLGLAIEAAFDLRSGYANSRHLDRFEDMMDEQNALLDSLGRADFTSDPGLLTRRAQTALDEFAAAVRQEVVDYVRPGIDPGAFHAALQRMTDRVVAAGVAFASLDLALDHPL
jgi:hypothetical protein